MGHVLGKAALLLAAIAQPPAMIPAIAQGQTTPATLMAGASRIDITPDIADLPKPFTRIDSRLYVRTVVLQSGGSRAVLVVGDLPTIASDVLEDLVRRIAAAAHAPVENVLMAVTHTHNAVRLDNNPVGIILPGSAKVTKITSDLIVRAVTEAAANLKPAKAGYGTGTFHLAAARMEPGTPQGGSQAATDRTLGVFKIEGEDGIPIALLVNNGPEPVMAGNGMKSDVSADVAGVMERYVEQRFGDKPVVLYTVGSPPGTVISGGGPNRRLPKGATPADSHALMTAVGTVLGEEVITATNDIKTSPELKISGMLKTLVCPGKITTPLNNGNSCSDAPGATLPKCVFTDKDGPPVALRFGVIQLGDVSLVQSDANILPAVWGQVKQGSPDPAKTVLVALGYGPVHYVVEDSAYPTNSYPVTASMVKAGCAAPGFVKDTLAMIQQSGGSHAR